MNPPIVAAALSLWYGGFQALAGVDLVAAPGEILALVGPAGCGKSTLLRCFNRMNEAPRTRIAGRLEVAGHDVRSPDVDTLCLRRAVGMVFQRPNPLPMSIRDNVLFGLRLHHGAPPRAEAERVVEDALTRVGLWPRVRDRLKHSAESLSLEERQKLCIARLLPLRPRILLLDEPCSALDPEGTRAIEDLMRSMQREVTQVIVTHNLAQARRIADRCAFMLLGELVEVGPTPAMFSAPVDPRTRGYLGGEYG